MYYYCECSILCSWLGRRWRLTTLCSLHVNASNPISLADFLTTDLYVLVCNFGPAWKGMHELVISQRCPHRCATWPCRRRIIFIAIDKFFYRGRLNLVALHSWPSANAPNSLNSVYMIAKNEDESWTENNRTINEESLGAKFQNCVTIIVQTSLMDG